MARLVLIYPTDAGIGRTFPLPAEPVVVGRARECAIRIDRESISRRHARISYSVDGWCVEDLGSTNGCSVNDVAVTRAILHDGDHLKVGVAILKLDAGIGRPPSRDGESGSPAPARRFAERVTLAQGAASQVPPTWT
ncbi:MAG TPA: FHA domain-containing protein [Kofleriaceae bacterium]|nr:FHA domain-containing protein [Kofleriaceae bacterium]